MCTRYCLIGRSVQLLLLHCLLRHSIYSLDAVWLSVGCAPLVITNSSIGYLRLILIKVVSGARVVLTLEQRALMHTWSSMQCERQPPCPSPSLLCYYFSPRPTRRTTHESSFWAHVPFVFYTAATVHGAFTFPLPHNHITTSPHVVYTSTSDVTPVLLKLHAATSTFLCTATPPCFHISDCRYIAASPRLFLCYQSACFFSSTPQFSINI